ncbi:MAG: PhnD/SsuA/transferrin family substrate-binding protein [Planctomycetota bacterium]
MLAWIGVAPAMAAHVNGSPLRMLVMDPMALPLSCSCVPGFAQRRYDQLADYLAERLGRPVETVFEESLGLGLRRINQKNDGEKIPFDVIIGKQSVVEFDSALTRTDTRLIAELTDKQGRTDLRGLFMVMTESPYAELPDLAGRRVAIGPEEDREAHGAAIETMNTKLRGAVSYESLGSIDSAVFALTDGEVDAAVISNYMAPLLEGCGKIEQGSIRSVGATDSTPFIGVFVTEAVDGALETRLRNLLVAAKADAALMLAIESRDGFVTVGSPLPHKKSPPTTATWSDWRGPDRTGLSEALPRDLPERPREVWSAKLTGPSVAGPAATERFVIVPDKSADLKRDIFRCLDASSGAELWTLEYEADQPVDYSNAPRATPVVVDDLVYLLGALGDLHCVKLETGAAVWKLNYYEKFGGELLTWGSSSPPLVLGNKLIINPGNPGEGMASIAALDRHTGEVLWQTTGHAAA